MESSLKEGVIENRSISLNISSSSFVGDSICYLNNTNLSSNIKLYCEIYGLSQDNRITNGINIEGIIKNNITDEYLITEHNEYIKLIDFNEIQFPNIECPLNFDIKHCKEVNKKNKECEKCHKNYYFKENDKSECLTCSQLNEGCSSCNATGQCKKCINGFDMNKNEKKCEIKKNCLEGEYVPECKTCEELNPNCIKCNKAGYCQKCNDGYYLSGIDNNAKCIKCISTCQKCESLNKCTKCKEDLILNDGNCVSCLSLNEGCEECSKINNKCTKCYDNKILKYILKDNKCVKKEEEKEKPKTNLKFHRFDGYEKEDNKVHFKPHFILLDNYLYNTTLHITIIIQIKIIIIENNYLRGLDEADTIITKNTDIICNQYGDALGDNNKEKGGYLANFKCTTDLEDDQELLSIEPTKMEIKDKDNTVVQSFETEQTSVKVDEMEKMALDEEYEKCEFNKLTILNITNINLNEKLYFDIVGNIASPIEKEEEYEIPLKDSDNKEIQSICYFPIVKDVEVDQTISCVSSDNTKSKKFKIDNGISDSKGNALNKMIVNIDENTEIVVPDNKGKSFSYIIIIIAVSGFIIICVIIFIIVKCRKNNNNDLSKTQDNNNIKMKKKKIKNTDDSKDIIVYNH